MTKVCCFFRDKCIQFIVLPIITLAFSLSVVAQVEEGSKSKITNLNATGSNIRYDEASGGGTAMDTIALLASEIYYFKNHQLNAL